MQPDNYSYQPGDLEKLSEEILSYTPRPNTTDCIPAICVYKIEKVLFSHPSRIIFAREVISGRRVVIKVLTEESNPRYDLSTIGKRQQAQLYALQWNKLITPDVYLGLAPVSDRVLNCFSPKGVIELGQIIENPEAENLDTSSEYAVVMLCLPEDLQLSSLLKYGLSSFRSHYVSLVTRRIANMHQMLEALPISMDSGKDWGSCQQLQGKLRQNIHLASSLLATHPTHQAIFKSVSESLLEVFGYSIYQRYFEQRRLDGYIKRCHGDLKTQNIWIVHDRLSEESQEDVKILDAIDFNPTFANIDILSDFAMLVVDIQARTSSVVLAENMIEWYLKWTYQENDLARFVLDYYLLEKILIRSAIRSASENLPEPDQTFLQIARGHLERFHSRISSRQFTRI